MSGDVGKLPATLCVIVRDDADRLQRCLQSVDGLFQRVIVVDTGSQDRSPDVARECGAELHQIPWPGAFDAARNYAFDLVETPWTMYLDSDEWLPVESRDPLAAALGREEALGYFLLRRNLYTADAYNEMRDLRLWRTQPELRHRGVCHAQLPEEALARAAEGRKVFDTDIAFWHDGYLGGVSMAKHQRGINLMRKELQIRPGQLYYRIELARTLKLLGDPEGAAEVRLLADELLSMQDSDEPPLPLAVALLSSELEQVPDADLRSPRTDAIIRLIRGWFPESPLAAQAAARLHVRRGELPQALRPLLEMETMAESGDYDRSIGFDPAILRQPLWTNLALVAHQVGRREVAIRNYRRLLEADPGNVMARANLAKLGPV